MCVCVCVSYKRHVNKKIFGKDKIFELFKFIRLFLEIILNLFISGIFKAGFNISKSGICFI